MTSPWTISAAIYALQTGSVSSLELVTSAVAIADEFDSRLGSFASRFVDASINAAVEADIRFASGGPIGALNGIPIGVKDVIATIEGPTRAGSAILDDEWVSGDATVVARLRAAGAVVMGKLTTMELGSGLPDFDDPFPIPRNPWDLDRWAGGSSSGSGSAVAIGSVLGALGTDTGGSVRIPAAFCGVTGLKPTYGLVPRTGVLPLGFSLDHVGPIARTAADCAILLRVIAGHDPLDPTSVRGKAGECLPGATVDLRQIRIGVDRMSRASGPKADPALSHVFENAVEVLRSAGAQVLEVELPLYDEVSFANRVIQLSEALAFHMKDLQHRWSEYNRATRAMLSEAVLYSGSDYVQAQRIRRAGQRAVSAVFGDVDVIATPTSSSVATPLLGRAANLAAEDAFGPIHTEYWNCIGGPSLSMPMGFSAEMLPLGMQISGRPGEDDLVLKVADSYQHLTGWHLMQPPLKME